MPDNPKENPNIETALAEQLRLLDHEATSHETFWASGMGQCPRRQIAQRAGLPPTNPADARARFKMFVGSVLHTAIQQKLSQGEHPFLDPSWVEKRVVYQSYTGRLDGITHQIEGDAVVEIKTSDDDSITKYKELPESYLWQGMFYCLATGIERLLIFQVGKNQGITRHRVLFLTDQWRIAIETQIGFIEREWARFVANGGGVAALPDHFHQFSWENRWCPYLEQEVWEPKGVNPYGA